MNKDTNQIMAQINAYRMDGIGNNFIIIDRRKENIVLSKDKIVKLSKNKIFTFDQLITLEKEVLRTIVEDEKLIYGPNPIRIFNPNGEEVAACGNGSRCVAWLIHRENNKKKIQITTKERILNAEIIGDKNVKLHMGRFKHRWNEIPLSKEMNPQEVKIDFLKKEYGYGHAVNIGNPHIVFFVEDCLKVNIKDLGPKIENHKFFPEKTNVTFAQIIDKFTIKANVWERGAGQTKACGTAACATAVAAWLRGLTTDDVSIIFSKGVLVIKFGGTYDNKFQELVTMSGEVSDIEKIKIDI